MKQRYLIAGLMGVLSLSVQAKNDPLPDLEDLLSQQLNQLPSNTQISAGSRIERSSSDSMAVTHVITDKDIRQFNLQSLADILTMFVGITTRDNSSFIYLGARGIGRPGDFNSRFLFLLDGTRMNENLLDAGLLGYENFVDVGLIERVEYSPGASAALYGNNALLGVINIVTKTSSKLRGLNTALSVTNDDTQHGRVTVGMRSDSGADSWLSLSGSRLRSKDFPVPGAPAELLVWQDLNKESSSRIMLSHQTGSLQLQAAASRRQRSFPDGFSVLFSGGAEQAAPELETLDNEAYFLALTFDDKISDDMEAYFHVSTHGNDLVRSVPLTLQSGEVEFVRPMNSGRWSNLDGQLVFLGVENHELMVGVDFQKDHRQEFSSRSSLPSQFNFEQKSNESRYGLYFQDLWRITPRFKLQWALRHDDSDFSPARWSPSFTLKYSFLEGHHLLLRHSRAFRVANFLERNANSVFSEPNPQNETIDYNELSLVQRWSDSLSSFATFYYADINNLIHQDFFRPIYFNPPPIRSHGFEFGMDKRWSRGMSLITNLAIQRSRLQGGFGIANSPEFIGKMRFSMPLGNSDLTLSLNTYGVSKRRTFDSHLPGYVSHDISLNWQNNPDLFVALGVRNITDKDILEITDDGFTPYLQRRRQVHLSVNWSWNND
ncbi:hypothetical protein CWB99_19905 [Pseudoalteromonas rubra]|uniref:TonB-dependent receptor n=1 Tax=Pseudoalteromonas rubra TaxID=43658 RepID=A0A5S3WHL4_9GAMM|nr:TonB-dependent receptor [Pseudoalteromonas rubra]TMP26024.1 hypothetical protein CWB99_19905 [Pseudoalteromonas rubra]TMP28462.1 hypothetical protein CWC00_21385 [Pseudoalteromonas rubra]